MGFFTQQTKIIELDEDGNRVTLKRLTFGESQQVLSESTRFDIVDQEAQLDFAKNQLLKLQKAIVSWEGQGFEGLPPTAENIARLPNDIGQRIVTEVDALNAALSDAEKKRSGAPTS
jgi:hypothetical protein